MAGLCYDGPSLWRAIFRYGGPSLWRTFAMAGLAGRYRVYILSYLTSVPFFFFVDCRVRVRVSSRVRDSVSFIFYCIFSFRCMLKDRKLQPGQPCWLSDAVLVLCLSSQSHGYESRACYNFFTFFFQLLLQVFCKSGLGLVLALRFVLRLR